MTRRALLTSAGLILLLSLGALSAGPSPTLAAGAHAAGSPYPVVLRPTNAQGEVISGPDYFTLTARPGTTTVLYAYIGNAGRSKYGISLTPLDGASGLYGGITFSLPTQPRKAVGSWVTMSRRWVALKSQRAMVVPFTVTVPRHTVPGLYIGGLSAFIQATRVQSNQTHMTLQLRIVNAIVVTVPGAGRTSLALGGISLLERGTLRFTVVNIQNTGTMPTKASFFIWLWKQGVNKPLVFQHLPVDSVLAGTGVQYPVQFQVQSAPGRYRALVQLTWPHRHGKPLVGDASFTVTR